MRTIGGTGNGNGDYWQQDAHAWLLRVPLQAEWLARMRRDRGLQWFAMTELHAEHSAHQPLMDALGKDWGVGTGPGGNLLLYVKDDLEIISTASATYPTKPDPLAVHGRWMTKWNVRDPYHPETKFWLSLEHYRSGTTPDIEAAKRSQARNGNAFLSTLWRIIRMGDFNSSAPSSDPTTPRGIHRSAGYRSLQHSAEEYANRDLNTGLHWGHDTVEIEDMEVRERPDGTSLVRVLKAEKHDARPLTDHSAWFTAEFDITDNTSLPKESL
jgi:hypothetical protein